LIVNDVDPPLTSEFRKRILKTRGNGTHYGSPCCVLGAIVFWWGLLYSAMSSDPGSDGTSGVVGPSVLSSGRAVSNPPPSDERSRFSAGGRYCLRCWSLFCLFLRGCWFDAIQAYNPSVSM